MVVARHNATFLILGSTSCVYHIRGGFGGSERWPILARLMIAERKLFKAIECGKSHS